MTASSSKTDELDQLYREASELRKKPRGRHRPANSSQDPSAAGMAPDETSAGWKEVEEAVSQLRDVADEIESAAAEHPVLALLTAFACGVLFGQMMSRKS